MSAITGQTLVTINVTDTLPAGVNRPAVLPNQCNPANLFTEWQPGSGPGQANKYFYWSSNIAASTPQIFDMTSVVCSDGTTGFAHVRESFCINADPTSVITFGGGSNSLATQWLSGTHTLQPGGIDHERNVINAAGYVVNSSNRYIKLDPGSNAIAGATYIAIGD